MSLLRAVTMGLCLSLGAGFLKITQCSTNSPPLSHCIPEPECKLHCLVFQSWHLAESNHKMSLEKFSAASYFSYLLPGAKHGSTAWWRARKQVGIGRGSKVLAKLCAIRDCSWGVRRASKSACSFVICCQLCIQYLIKVSCWQCPHW